MKNDKLTQPSLTKSTRKTIEQDLLGHIYNDINARCKEVFDMYTLNELTSFPLIFCEKLIQSFTSNESETLSNEQFIRGFNVLYFSSIQDIINQIARICAFDKKGVWINDIRLLLLHFHMHLMTNETEKTLTQILYSFFNEENDKKHNYYISIEDFVSRALNKNRDIVSIFIAFLHKFSFFSKEQIEYYSIILNSKEEIPPVTKWSDELLSNDCSKYIQLIEDTSIFLDPYNDDDLETLESISTFESEISVALSNLNRNQIDIPNKNNFYFSNTETVIQNQARRGSDFTNKAKHFFLARTATKTKSVKNHYINPIKPRNDKQFPLNEIVLYTQSSKDKRMKTVKLIQLAEMIFYFKFNPSLKQFSFKKVIILKMLFPKITPHITIQNKTYYRLELLSVVHNQFDSQYYYNQNEDELNDFMKEIITSQNIRTIEDCFELGQKLGSGKFGKVILAKHILTGNDYAIKMVCKSNKEHSEKTFESYKWEKDIGIFLKNVSCDYIEKFYDIIESSRYLYYVTEYYPDGNVKDLLSDLSCTWSDMDDICAQLIKGVSVLHQYGILHRDIKHTNTLVSKNDLGTIKIKIIDFGLSRVIGINEKAKEKFGSLSFKAPELILGKEYSFGVDIWAIGITAYYLAFRQFPVKATNKHTLKKKIVNKDYTTLLESGNSLDNFLSEIITKCIVKQPQKRYDINKLLKCLLKYNLCVN